MEVELTDDARTLIGNLGYDPTYGARPLKRVIQKQLVDKLALKLLEGEFQRGRPRAGGRRGRRADLREGRRRRAGARCASLARPARRMPGMEPRDRALLHARVGSASAPRSCCCPASPAHVDRPGRRPAPGEGAGARVRRARPRDRARRGDRARSRDAGARLARGGRAVGRRSTRARACSRAARSIRAPLAAIAVGATSPRRRSLAHEFEHGRSRSRADARGRLTVTRPGPSAASRERVDVIVAARWRRLVAPEGVELDRVHAQRGVRGSRRLRVFGCRSSGQAPDLQRALRPCRAHVRPQRLARGEAARADRHPARARPLAGEGPPRTALTVICRRRREGRVGVVRGRVGPRPRRCPARA